ncbi:predicted protein [Nematostella vectensis]|uniref:Uncharacterized protein n=1 Tax=Nematostella vectensis TaxID=45351 RepID=A7S991_NEMVE|nr:predicted protein [Nematostella vectensis]|eukprot:XP_001631777.1 predicted protein [Nematostella vectensis]
MSKENIVKDMVETMEKDTLRNTDNMVDNFVPDNEGATKDPTPDNEKVINDHVPDSEGEIKASAVLDNKEEINDSAVLDKEKDIKNSAVLDNEREIKDSAAAVVASLKAEISRQEDNYAQLTRANKELKMNVLRWENDIENVVNTSGFREQTVELSMITFQDLNNELFHNNLWQIRENQIAKKKIKELEDLQAENARKIAELTEATTKLADANARLIETGLAKQE